MFSKTAILLAAAPFIAAVSACSGGFASTCSEISKAHEGGKYYLNAYCGTNDGGHRHTTYNLGNCIGNNDGKLVCGDGGGFQYSCNTVTLSGTVLHAYCKDDGGNYIATSINLDNIIGNFNGYMHC